MKGGGNADDGITTFMQSNRTKLVNAGKRFVAWFDLLIDTPP